MLEKEFDKAFIDFDTVLAKLVNETDTGDMIEDGVLEYADELKEKVKLMSCAWAQLVHKSQTIFQVNCKLEAQLVNMRSDLVEARAYRQASQKELEKMMIELHTAQLEKQRIRSTPSSPHPVSSSHTSNNTSGSNSVDANASTNNNNNNNNSGGGENATSSVDVIQKKLEEELKKRLGPDNETMALALVQSELAEYKKENRLLREQFVNLNSEVFGARLAAKYLDKELAGRIQQIQLFGKNLKADEHERLWNQLENEINLHRHKTVMKACRSKRLNQRTTANLLIAGTGAPASVSPPRLPPPSPPSPPSLPPAPQQQQQPQKQQLQMKLTNETSSLTRSGKERGKEMPNVRTVCLRRNDKEGLGISITGGQEHGVPILISDVHENGPAARSGELFVGDAILNANNIDLRDVMHADAVRILTSLVSF